MIKKIILIVVLLLQMELAFAYIDPGTAGMIIGGGIWPWIVAIMAAIGGFLLKFFFRPIKRGVLKAWGKIKRKS